MPLDARSLHEEFPTLPGIADLSRPRLHEMRHAAAILTLGQGRTMQEVQAMMGHSQISVTTDYYAHLMPGALKHVADRMDAAFATGTDD